MQRRRFLLGLGSTALGGSALLGSGAFTRVQSQRRVKIEVAHDSEAYLGLVRREEYPNASYVDYDDKSHLRVRLNPENPNLEDPDRGTGVNSDSTSTFHDLFDVCNHGKQPVCVWFEKGPVQTVMDPDSSLYGEDMVIFYRDGDPDDRIDREDDAFELDVGECAAVGLQTRTYSIGAGSKLLNEVTAHAGTDWC